MAEEIADPEIMIPKAIIGTVIIGFVTSFSYVIAMFFSVQNLDDILNSNTGVPILDIYYQALGSKNGALCLETLIVLTAFGCNIASHTWQARLCWSFSRDNGLPGSKYWSKVNTKTGVPINAHIMSCCLVALLGCIYLGSSTAFNSMVTACILFLLLSYIIPTACLLYRKRNIQQGPFWLGKFGLFSNIVVICWTIFAMVFFTFPYTMPVEKDNMNYASVVLVGIILFFLVYWFARGKRTFRNKETKEKDSIVYENSVHV